jgi:hypothetical protein
VKNGVVDCEPLAAGPYILPQRSMLVLLCEIVAIESDISSIQSDASSIQTDISSIESEMPSR